VRDYQVQGAKSLANEESLMPQTEHTNAAELHTHAAYAHIAAAHAHSTGDCNTEQDLTRLACGRSEQAARLSEEIARAVAEPVRT
jgi:hypothetical protein